MSGSGRGRAWLRLGQNTAPVRPGNDPISNDSLSSTEDKSKPTVNTYSDLVEMFQILNVDDDGIAVNNKIFHIRSEFMKKCPNANLISEAVEAIHEECLINGDISQKFLLFITSAHFQNKQISDDQLIWRDAVRRSFITHLQNDFEAAEENRKKCRTKFYNGVKLCSSFFYSLSKFQSTIYPAVEKISTLGYLKILLKYDTPSDISLITYLVCRHSSILLDLLNDQECQGYYEILSKLKLMIIRNSSISESLKMHIFFTYELLAREYKLREDELEFYKSNMKEADFSEILSLLNYLPHFVPISNGPDNRRKTEEINSSHSTEANMIKKKFPQQSTLQNYKSSDENTSSTSEELDVRLGVSREQYTYKPSDLDMKQREQSTYKSNELDLRRRDGYFVPNNLPSKKENFRDHPNDSMNTQERIGRPILGIGARLKKM